MRISILTVASMVLLSSLLLLCQDSGSDAGYTLSMITVDDSGGKDHTTIQEALNASSPGDLIHIYPGEYAENLVITKNVTIFGDDPSETIIEAAKDGDVISVTASNVTIRGLTIRSEFEDNSGINLGDSWNCIIEQCIVKGNNQGISSYGKGNVIRNNTIKENDNGIVLGNTRYETLLMGNSYTAANGLDTLVEGLLRNNITKADSFQLTGGGLKLSDHANSAITPGHQWNNTLNVGTPWKQVLLQDQSQVPSFPTDDPYWVASLTGAKTLNGMIEKAGGDTIFLMTWGYRDGDSLNPEVNPNYTAMQKNLENGYRWYAENCSTPERPVYIAPCGLAWKHVHDNIVEMELEPTDPGNLFYDLYEPDGGHPALPGSYLAACVIYATITGRSPIGLGDNTFLNNTYRQLLQEAAHATVFNETSHYLYPWENNNRVSFANNNSIYQNEFLDNDLWGISVIDEDDTENRIHHNDLVNNNNGFTQARDNGYKNQWDDGMEGNFWSDYSLRYPSSTNNSKVWDIPYVMAGERSSSDDHPLVDRNIEHDTISPFADAGPDIFIDEGSIVIFNGSGSYDNVGIVNYTWSFSYNSSSIFLFGQEASFLFDIPGYYSVLLVVTDDEGNMDQDRVYVLTNEIMIPDITPPVPLGGLDLNQSVINGTKVSLYAGIWMDPESEIIEYSWSFSYNSVDHLFIGENVSFLFNIAGNYSFILNVMNSKNLSTDFHFWVNVFNDDIPPVAVAGGDVFLDQHDTLILDGSESYDNRNAIVNYTWVVEEESNRYYFGEVASHVFHDAGVFNVSLIVADIHGNIGFDVLHVTVKDTTRPILEAGPDITIDQHGSVFLNVTSISDNIGIVQYLWTVHDVEISIYQYDTPLHRFNAAGEYLVTLIVYDTAGNNATDSFFVYVMDIEPPMVNFTLSLTQIYQGDTIILDGSGCTDNVGIRNWTWTINGSNYYGEVIEISIHHPGSYEIVLEVFDERGNSATDSIWIDVEKLNETALPDDDTDEKDRNLIGPILIGSIILISIILLLILLLFIFSKRDERSNSEE